MRRVLIYATLLTVLTLTGLAMVLQVNGRATSLWVYVITPGYGEARIWAIHIPSGERRALTPSYDYIWPLNQPDNSHWLYYFGSDGQTTTSSGWVLGRVYRVHVTGSSVQPLTDDIELNAQVSPDGEWLVYFDGNALFTRRLSDGAIFRPDHLLESGYTPDPEARFYFSADGTWMYFTIYAPPPSIDAVSTDIFRARLDGTALENLTNTPETYNLLDAGPSQTGWLVFSEHKQLYRMRENGEELTLIANDAEVWWNMGRALETGIAVVKPYPMIDEVRSWGVRLDDLQVVWSLPDMQPMYYSSERQRLVMWSEKNGSLNSMQVDGSQRQFLGQIPTIYSIWGWTADDEWLLYEVRDAVNRNKWRIYRVSTLDQTIELLWEINGIFEFEGWTADGAWVVYRLDGDLHLMRPDASDHIRLTTSGSAQWIHSWTIPE